MPHSGVGSGETTAMTDRSVMVSVVTRFRQVRPQRLGALEGRPAEQLDGDELSSAVQLEAAYLGTGLSNIIFPIASQRIVIGNGVAELPSSLPTVPANQFLFCRELDETDFSVRQKRPSCRVHDDRTDTLEEKHAG